MRFNFSLVRLIILVAALLVFSILGGFSPPDVEHAESLADERRIHRAWLLSLAIFGVGAVAVSIIDHTVGLLDPTNLRLLYIVVGIVLMIFAIYWQNAIKSSVVPEPETEAAEEVFLRPADAGYISQQV